MNTNDIELPPDPARVMEGLRDTGYNFNTAIADIIDNSIAASASCVNIQVVFTRNAEVKLYVADNGCGMDFDGLKNAMRYGSIARQNKASLGKFGLGLKTASTAFCKCLSVISKGSDLVARKVQWDLDYITTEGAWKLKQPATTQDELDCLNETAKDGTGTLVVWEKTDRLIRTYVNMKAAKNAVDRLVSELKFHISLVYQRFLDFNDTRAPNIKILLNGSQVDPWDPFCSTEKETVSLALQEEVTVVSPDTGDSIPLIIRPFLIPRRDEYSSKDAEKSARVTNEMQGFYIYRENRLIHYGDWMSMFSQEPHCTLLRVELSFDHQLDDAFQVDIKKSRILFDNSIFSYIKESIMPPLRRAADERYRVGTKKLVVDASATAHDASNQCIDEKAPSLEESRVQIENEETGDVLITNKNGTFNHRLIIRTSSKPGECRIVPVKDIESGFLWQPTIVDEKHAVELNMSHPYYQKIYYPILSQNVLVTGLDTLLWALGEAELSTFNKETRLQYEDMRYHVSKALKTLLLNLPDPERPSEE